MTAARWVARADPEFPAPLLAIPDPPEGLWVRSALAPEDLAGQWRGEAAVAIVGSRGASSAGLEIARELAWDLARAGVLLVSGLARGIDGAAHAGALAAGGRSIAVLGCGLDLCYPPEHARLAGEIAASGALLSEYPDGTPAVSWHFPRRNRLISGLCAVTVLVEGEARSGAWHTVESALAQGREVMAVPRDPWLPGSVAPNRLLRDGAPPATCAGDILALLGLRAQARRRRGAAGKRAEAEAAAEPLVAAGLSRGPATLEQLAGRCPQIPLAQLQASLVALEIGGRVTRDRCGLLRWREER